MPCISEVSIASIRVLQLSMGKRITHGQSRIWRLLICVVFKKKKRSDVYSKPTGLPLNVYAEKCRDPDKSLQALMGLTEKTEIFRGFMVPPNCLAF